MTDGIGTSPSRERSQLPAQDDEKKAAAPDKSKTPSRPDGIGTSP